MPNETLTRCPLCDREATLPSVCACGAPLRTVCDPSDSGSDELASELAAIPRAEDGKVTGGHLCLLESDGSWLIWSLQRPVAEGEMVAANGVWASWKHYPPGFGEVEQEQEDAEPS